MEAQYRCKCGKAIYYPNEKCPDCGSLGPHNFTGRSVAAVESADVPKPLRHREAYIPELIDRPPAARPEKYSAPPEDNTPVEPRHSGGRAFEEDDSRFPAGMRSHSPILDHIRHLEGESKESKKKAPREKSREYEEQDEERPVYLSDRFEDEEKEKEQPRPSGNGGIASTIISIVLVLALVIAALYVINNFEEITRWLASPTVPEFLKPSAE